MEALSLLSFLLPSFLGFLVVTTFCAQTGDDGRLPNEYPRPPLSSPPLPHTPKEKPHATVSSV